jgi:hypothetical protein
MYRSSPTLTTVKTPNCSRTLPRSGRLIMAFVAFLLALALLLPVDAAAQQSEPIRANHAQAAQSIPLIEQDSLALLAFYRAAFGFNGGGPVSTWPSWHSIENGRVVGIWMFRAGADGVIPPAIGRLTALKELTIIEDDLEGPLPPEIGNLTELEILNIEQTNIEGPIPPEIGNLTNLKELDLRGNNLTGPLPPDLGNLTQLETLELLENRLSGPVPPELGNLSNLWILDLGFTGLSGSIPLSFINLSNLEFFNFAFTNLCRPDIQAFHDWIATIDELNIIRAFDGSEEVDAGPGRVCDASELDTTPPECKLVESVKNSHIKVLVQDPESGLEEIKIVKSTNATVTTSDHLPFTTSPVYVTATKIQPKKASVLELEVTDMAGNVTRCDPVLTTLAAEVPSTFALEGNYPNPFNPSTTIRFHIAEPSHVTLTVFDVMGRTVARLVDQEMPAGSYAAEWDGKSDAGLIVAGGIYFYRLEAGSYVETRAMSLVK